MKIENVKKNGCGLARWWAGPYSSPLYAGPLPLLPRLRLLVLQPQLPQQELPPPLLAFALQPAEAPPAAGPLPRPARRTGGRDILEEGNESVFHTSPFSFSCFYWGFSFLFFLHIYLVFSKFFYSFPHLLFFSACFFLRFFVIPFVSPIVLSFFFLHIFLVSFFGFCYFLSFTYFFGFLFFCFSVILFHSIFQFVSLFLFSFFFSMFCLGFFFLLHFPFLFRL